MDWRQKRINDLNQRLLEKVELLADYESELDTENDPQPRKKWKQKIKTIKTEITDLNDELSGLNGLATIGTFPQPLPNTNYEALEFVIMALLMQQVPPTDISNDFTLTDPAEKMSKNELTTNLKFTLVRGLGMAKEVHDFIQCVARIRFPDLPERLRATLKLEYQRLISHGIKGDELFKALHQFASCNSGDINRQLAGLAVLCYFFETCDVFEP